MFGHEHVGKDFEAEFRAKITETLHETLLASAGAKYPRPARGALAVVILEVSPARHRRSRSPEPCASVAYIQRRCMRHPAHATSATAFRHNWKHCVTDGGSGSFLPLRGVAAGMETGDNQQGFAFDDVQQRERKVVQ